VDCYGHLLGWFMEMFVEVFVKVTIRMNRLIWWNYTELSEIVWRIDVE
jgi:hypothetical protein